MAPNFFKKKEKQPEEIKTVVIEKREEPVELDKENQDFLKSPEGTTPPTVLNLEEKGKEIRKKKIRFNILFYIFLISLFLLIFGGPAIKFYKQNFLKQTPVVKDDPEPTEPVIKPIEIDPESIVEYSNNDLRISLDRLYKTSLFENIEEAEKTKKIEIIYDKNNPGKNISVEELSEGYIFRVSVFSTTLRKIDEIAQVKKEAFISSCPKTTTLTNTEAAYVNGIEGRTFQVNNCGSDFKVTYVVKNGLNYEFSQIFKGDLGYRQAYKAETENILRSVEFYPDETPDLGPLETYQNIDLRFSFDYPRVLSKDCCKATGPISERSEFLFSIGDAESYVNENNFDAITIYRDSGGSISFYDYLEKQKSLLADDYIVTMGEPPKPEIRAMRVGNKDATMLRGYSWRGNDLIYINISKEEESARALIISIKNLSGDSFDNVVTGVLNSFRFE